MFDRVKQYFSERAQSVKQNISGMVGGIITDAQQQATEATSKIVAQTKKQVNDAITSVTQSAVESVKTTVQNETKEMLGSASEGLDAVAKEAKRAIFSTAGDVAKNASSQSSGFLSKALNFFGVSPKEVTRESNNFGKLLNKFIFGQAKSLSNIIDDAKPGILSLLIKFVSILIGGLLSYLNPTKSIKETTESSEQDLAAVVAPGFAPVSVASVAPVVEPKSVWDGRTIFDNTAELTAAFEEDYSAGNDSRFAPAA